MVGHNVTEADQQSICVASGEKIELVKEFRYLGSIIADNGRIDAEVDSHIANALVHSDRQSSTTST